MELCGEGFYLRLGSISALLAFPETHYHAGSGRSWLIFTSLIVVLADIGDNLAYIHGLHFCEEVYPNRNRKKV